MNCQWVVMLPGEDAAASELYGPFRLEGTAQGAADAWNRNADPDDQALVMPLRPGRAIASTKHP